MIPQKESRTVVRKRLFSLKGGVPELMELLRVERITGKVTVNLAQGGISSVEVEENLKLPLDNSSGVR